LNFVLRNAEIIKLGFLRPFTGKVNVFSDERTSTLWPVF